jgi:hypothetical protein
MQQFAPAQTGLHPTFSPDQFQHHGFIDLPPLPQPPSRIIVLAAHAYP